MAQQPAPAENSRVFILDIGTRSVVGIAGHRQGDLFVVEARAVEPHPRRAMVDGQIEDIQRVAEVAGLVKSRIEQQLGTVFTQVGVAAAGRALKTTRATAEMQLPEGVPITAQTAYTLEGMAINAARLELRGQDAGYYCAGHSVVRTLLDDYPFATLIGHRGSRAAVEIIATFLPAAVVDSLRRCMELLGLEVDTLTLEPIAAMRAVIPPELRLLNLALVDIGAGTSDIALAAGGSVAGYTMATMAGDEITEALIRQYLVDFATAERLKMEISLGETSHYTDILGFEHTVSAAELAEAIAPAVDALAEVIAERIRQADAGAPAAVFVVGGGGKTPGLCRLLAEKLGLPENRVALAGTQFSGKVLSENSGLDAPEFATPVGIALTAADNAAVEGPCVTVNGRRVRLFAQTAVNAMDALLQGGYTYSHLMGRNGRPLTFTLNGARTTVRGGVYTPAELSVNGRPASLATPVEKGDQIEIVTAECGADARATVADYAHGEQPLRVTLNGRALPAGLIVRLNGAPAAPDTPLREQDALELYLARTAGELCVAAGIGSEQAAITLNGSPASPAAPLHDGDVLTCGAPQGPADGPQDAPQPTSAMPEPLPGAPLPPPPAGLLAAAAEDAPPAKMPAPKPEPPAETPAPKPPAVMRRGLRVTLNGRTVVLPPKPDGEPHRLFDMLPLVDIDPAAPGGAVRVSVNGRDTPYLEELVNGDVVDIGRDPP